MDYLNILEDLIIKNDSKIIFLILDGLGGLEKEDGKGTELSVARTPNLDDLAAKSICGLMDPIAPGITPGSGPSHFALFGYDPLENNVGRGLLSAAGINFPLTERDIAARLNFCTIDKTGKIIDRRAGRITSEKNAQLCKLLQDKVRLKEAGFEIFIETEKEHRGVLILRGDHLSDDISDTDPQIEGVPPLEPCALKKEAENTALLLKDFLSQTKDILAQDEKANMILLRGFARHKNFRSITERFGLRSAAITLYPMYKGIARLLGMEVIDSPATTIEGEFDTLIDIFPQYDFFYLHIKQSDSQGEDGNFEGKVEVIERLDKLLPRLLSLNPTVLVVTGDHSTPAIMASHSFHPLPLLLFSKICRRDGVGRFDEISCVQGGLGRIRAVELMGLALAHAKRLKKFGA